MSDLTGAELQALYPVLFAYARTVAYTEREWVVGQAQKALDQGAPTDVTHLDSDGRWRRFTEIRDERTRIRINDALRRMGAQPHDDPYRETRRADR